MMKTNWKITLGILLSALFCANSHSVKAQEVENRNHYYSEKFCDNMFISAGAGINLFMVKSVPGFSDQHPLTVAGSFAAGKWLSPYTGLRLEITGAPVKIYELNAEGTGLNKKSVGYLGFYGDFMWNMFNTFWGYNEDRLIDVIPFAGISYMTMLSRSFDDYADFQFPISAGLQAKIRLNHYIDFYVQGRMAFTTDQFDGRFGKRIEPMLTATAGAVWNIGRERFQTYNPYESMMVRASLNEKVNELRADLTECMNKECPELAQEIEDEQPSIMDCPESLLSSVVSFDINSDVIQPDQQVNIYSASQWMKMHPDNVVEVIGFADKDTGTPEYNMDLSMRRAKAVAHELMTTYGIPESSLKVIAKGAMEQPFPQENAWNRVVIFIGDDVQVVEVDVVE